MTYHMEVEALIWYQDDADEGQFMGMQMRENLWDRNHLLRPY